MSSSSSSSSSSSCEEDYDHGDYCHDHHDEYEVSLSGWRHKHENQGWNDAIDLGLLKRSFRDSGFPVKQWGADFPGR